MVGGDCTSHAGAMAGLKRRFPASRLAIAWFDAHGDFNIPTTTPSSMLWGMPFAMLCGRGDAALVAQRSGPDGEGRTRPSWAPRSWTSRNHGCSPRLLWPSSAPGCSAARGPRRARDVGAGRRRPDGWDVHRVRPRRDRPVGGCVRRDAGAEGAVRVDGDGCAAALAATNRIVGFGPTATMPRSGSTSRTMRTSLPS